MSLTASTLANTHQGATDSRYYSRAGRDGPAGARHLWSWGWAGAGGALITDKYNVGGVKERIRAMKDASGQLRDFYNDTGDKEPGYQVGLSEDGYVTSLPIITLDYFADSTQIFGNSFLQDATMTCPGSFYLAFAGMNTRGIGVRDMWGSTTLNQVRLDHENRRVRITINGGAEQIITANSAVPHPAPVLLEVWRDDANRIHCWINGVDASLSAPEVTNSETFTMSGFGWNGDGSGSWDDFGFEFLSCYQLPDATARAAIRTHLNNRWGLYA